MNQIVQEKIVPGIGLTLMIGNTYYAWMAIRLTNRWGRQYTAQPYGINTYAAFATVFNIIYPVFFANVDALGPNEAFWLAYRVALSSNFISGIISIVLGLLGPILLRLIQPVALLVPIAAIGIAFLGLEQLASCMAAPIVGINTILWVFFGWYAGVKIGVGKYRLPEALTVILVGVALGWATGLNTASEVREASKLVGAVAPTIAIKDVFSEISITKEYLGIIIPLGISTPASSLMCLVCSKEAGDPFPVRETLIFDGVGTTLASFLGSPFGTVVYIGHPAHRKSGATVGYSISNGFIYMILSFFGVLAVFQTIVNTATIGPIVFTIGLLVNEEILNFLSPRHYAAYLIGLFPAIYDWVVNISGRTPLEDTVTGYNKNFPGSWSWVGVLAWKRGSLLISMVWTAMVVAIIDRRFPLVAIWALVGALLSAVGIIHVPIAGFENFTTPIWEQCDAQTDECWEFAEQWMFFTAYLMIAVTCLIINYAKRFDLTIQEEIADSYSNAFSDWFANAATKSHPADAPKNLGNSQMQSQMTHTFGDVTVTVSENVGYSDGRFRFTISADDRRIVVDAKNREAGQQWLQSLELADGGAMKAELEELREENAEYEQRLNQLLHQNKMKATPPHVSRSTSEPTKNREEFRDGEDPRYPEKGSQNAVNTHPHVSRSTSEPAKPQSKESSVVDEIMDHVNREKWRNPSPPQEANHDEEGPIEQAPQDPRFVPESANAVEQVPSDMYQTTTITNIQEEALDDDEDNKSDSSSSYGSY